MSLAGLAHDAIRLALHAMGTRFELVLVDPSASAPALRALGEAALDEVRLWHERLSRFQPESLVSRINREARLRPVRVDPESFELLALCARVWADSDGAFDPTLGARMDGATDGPIGFDAVALDPRERTIFFSRPVALDLGAIAKGFALDRAADVLRAHGVPCAFLHGGASGAIALGSPPTSPPEAPRAWRIRVRSDGDPIDLDLRDAALSVSAPRGRSIELAGVAAPHILDPRSGGAAGGADTAAVVGPSAALCDAWSTALVVLGARPARMPDALASLIHDAGGWRINDPLSAMRARAPSASRDTTMTTEAA